MKVEWDFKELYDFADRLGEIERFEKQMKRATQKIAGALLTRMKRLTPIEDGELIEGWEGNRFFVTEKDGGFEVLIVNKDNKAPWVNDGHRACNQFGGPYPIKRRVKVTSPHKWQQGNHTWYVFGHFFVERGIEELNSTKQIENIIYQKLKNWWEGCING